MRPGPMYYDTNPAKWYLPAHYLLQVQRLPSSHAAALNLLIPRQNLHPGILRGWIVLSLLQRIPPTLALQPCNSLPRNNNYKPPLIQRQLPHIHLNLSLASFLRFP